MDTMVYFLDVDPAREPLLATEAGIMALAGRLSESRREKISSMKYLEGKRQSLGAGLLLAYGLRRLGLEEKSARIIYGGNKKPYLADREDLFFNLSHSGTLVMAAFAGSEVGCDVEQVKQANFRVARRFFAPEEQAYLESCATEAEKNETFFRLWTLKEAFLKVTGEGSRLPLSDFCIRLGQGAPSVEWKKSGGEFCFFERPLSGYRAAVCRRGKEADCKTFFSFQNLADVI